MGKFVDRVGGKYGRLTVVERVANNKNHHSVYRCLCECGNYVNAVWNNLRTGNTRSCGCLRPSCAPNALPLIGHKFDRLLVLAENRTQNKIKYWNCVCDCGNFVCTTTGKLRGGHTKSCGCLRKDFIENKRIKRKVTPDGYVFVRDEKKLLESSYGVILEHRQVMRNHLGRELYEHENVHHKNGDRQDNRLENLEIWNTSQPSGQRVPDKLFHYIWFITKYEKEMDLFGEISLETVDKAIETLSKYKDYAKAKRAVEIGIKQLEESVSK